MDSGSNVIQTQGLGKSYEEIHALKDLDLKVPKNSIFGFLGPNGAGKTTTMKLLLGLTRASAGGGNVFGLDISENMIKIANQRNPSIRFEVGDMLHLRWSPKTGQCVKL